MARKPSVIAAPKSAPVELEYEEDIAAIKTAYVAAFKADTTLTDTAIDKMIVDAAKAEREMSMDDWLKALRTAEGHEDNDKPADKATTDKPKSITVLDKEAVAFGEQLSTSDELMSEVADTIETKEKSKRHTTAVAFDLWNLWGGKAELVAAELSDKPLPGSRVGSKPGYVKLGVGNASYEVKSNAKPDIVKAGEPSWWHTAFSVSTVGKPLVAASNAVKDKTDPACKNMGKEEYDAYRKVAESRVSSGIRVLKDAFFLLLRFEELRQTTKLTARFRTTRKDDKTILAPHSNVLIKVRYYDADKEPHDKWFTAGSFSNVDLDKVRKHDKAEDQFAAFQVDREPGGNEKEEKEVFTIQNIKDGVTALEELSDYLNSREGRGEMLVALNKAGSDIHVLDLFKLKDAINLLCNNAKMQARFLTVSEHGTEAAEVEKRA